MHWMSGGRVGVVVWKEPYKKPDRPCGTFSSPPVELAAHSLIHLSMCASSVKRGTTRAKQDCSAFPSRRDMRVLRRGKMPPPT
mmetsp:Transcript_11391/g.30181  ORF Transcript_11391/g.30181 Transcript_11391/m.30181 type:complete len:83 (-) Transcript_11391:1877-2125(-)